MTIPLICPHDKTTLEKQETHHAYVCNNCGQEYAINKGVTCFLEKPDQFYEGSYKNQTKFVPRSEHWYAIWPLWLITNGYIWKVRRHLPKNSVVLELGCASGIAYFGTRYRMIGVDVSLSSLIDTAKQYECCLYANAAHIPLPDNSVDGIVSSYFWEHISPDKKPNFLAEYYRILKPGGKLIFLYDIETKNPLMRWMIRKNSNLYQQLFIDGDGHLGYETVENNKELFQKRGFLIKEHFGMERTLVQSPSVFTKLSQWGGVPGTIGRVLAAGLSRSTLLFYGYTLLVRIVDQSIGRFFPNRWARIVMTVCIKS